MALVALPNPNRPFPFSRLRQSMLAGALQEGVVNAGDLKVTQRAAGANMSVDVAAGQAFIRTDIDAPDGLAYIYSDAVANVAVAASNATLPRVDRVTARYNDSTAGTGAGDDPTIAVLTGTATTGATLDNLTGAAAVTTDSVLLADVLVPAASTSVTNANIRDRRPWARGAFNRLLRASTSLTIASNTLVLMDGTNLQARIECTGNPMRCTFTAIAQHSAAATNMVFGFMVDGVQSEGTLQQSAVGANLNNLITATLVLMPTAGSHLIGSAFATGAATLTVVATPANPAYLTIEEIVRPNTNNS